MVEPTILAPCYDRLDVWDNNALKEGEFIFEHTRPSYQSKNSFAAEVPVVSAGKQCKSDSFSDVKIVTFNIGILWSLM